MDEGIATDALEKSINNSAPKIGLINMLFNGYAV